MVSLDLICKQGDNYRANDSFQELAGNGVLADFTDAGLKALKDNKASRLGNESPSPAFLVILPSSASQGQRRASLGVIYLELPNTYFTCNQTIGNRGGEN